MYNQRVAIRELLQIAEELSLACIVRATEITVFGTKQLLIFKRQENETCQLIQVI